MTHRFSTLFVFALTAVITYAQSSLGGIRPKHCGTSMIMEREAAMAKGQQRVVSSAGRYVPHVGTVTIPVILVNFSDVKFTVNNPREAFEQFFNGAEQQALGNGNEYNHGSVAQYFSDMSSGVFTPAFKVYEPVTLDRNETYYGGSNEEDNNDELPRQLVKDAVDALVASGQVGSGDTAVFSSDGRTIDCVYVVYAGAGQNYGGGATTVWANTWTADANTTIGGKRVRWYSMAGELSPYKLTADGSVSNAGTIPMITGVGVTCHELSHALGLPDFYPTSSSAYIDNQEMEYWDIMDGGEYSGNGFCPTAYTTFEKNELGWPVTIIELTESRAVEMVTPTESSGTSFKITNPLDSSEYFLLENIRKSGWNARQYGSGLLVYHVNRPSGALSSSTRFNNKPNYPGMAVVPADGACLSSYIDANADIYIRSLRGDLFPGTGNISPDTLDVSELSDAKPQPNFCWYNAEKTQKLATNKALRNISYDTATGAVSFYYVHDMSTGIENTTAKAVATDNHVYSLDGSLLGSDLNVLPHGIYIKGGRKVVK